jgi:hypothetical protein
MLNSLKKNINASVLNKLRMKIPDPPVGEIHYCNKHDDESSLGLEDEEESKFNMVVNKFFPRESFGKGFILTKEHHIHSNYRATCDQDSHFMVLNKKGFIKIQERILKK